MKILLLNPHIDAAHQILKFLQANHHALLLPENAAEAWQMAKLHGPSLDLAIIHREPDSRSANDRDVGLKLVEQLKKDPSQADLPILLSSDTWNDSDFVRHQETPTGVNAYLRWPFSDTQLKETLQALFGDSFSSGPPGQEMPSALSEPPSLSFETSHTAGAEYSVVLEDANGIYSNITGSTSISLEAPWSADPEPVEATLPSAITAPESGIVDLSASVDISSNASPELELSVSPTEIPQMSVELPPEPLSSPSSAPAISTGHLTAPSMMLQPMPFGDAVVPGGAAHSPDVETLKKYLLLREQDVATLSAQLRSAKEQLSSMSSQLEEERLRNSELVANAEEHKRAIEDARKAGESERQSLRKEIEDLRFEIKVKMDKARLLESQVREATQEMDRLKERVRSDIRKIRVREKELENRLEIVRSDSEVLVNSREGKIVELKRKLDLLEFNMDLLQDRYSRERENSIKLRERLVKAAQVVRVAGGVLDSPGSSEIDSKDEDKQEAS